MNLWEVAEAGDVDSLLSGLKERKSGVAINKRHPQNAWQAIHLACRAAQAPIVETLVRYNGINLDKKVCSSLFELYNTAVGTAETVKKRVSDIVLIEAP